jgi:hypothetical protein
MSNLKLYQARHVDWLEASIGLSCLAAGTSEHPARSGDHRPLAMTELEKVVDH